MIFIGLDLAWSDRNYTGLAIFEGDELGARVLAVRLVRSDEEIIEEIDRASKGKPVFVAIDAPLVVPNRTGRRRAEELVGMLFRQFDAGAHPANRTRLKSSCGRVRGEDIVRLLAEKKISHDPQCKPFERSRKCFEVYPHPAMVVIFGLKRILRYKAKPKRSLEERHAAFKEYQRLLRNLPDLHLPIDLVSQEVSLLNNTALKEYEDMLDGVFCGYIAYYAWKHPEKCAVLGNLREGYILTPVLQGGQDGLEKFS